MTLSSVAYPREHPGYAESMTSAAESAELVRGLVRSALDAWGLGSLADDGVLVVTELVANAAQHAEGEEIRVAVFRRGRNLVRIDVTDASRLAPVRRTAGAEDIRGRGLALVAAMSTRWGTERLPQGKCVWAELLCETAEPPGPWVGDEVHDAVTDRPAILTDIRSDGTHLLRTPRGPDQWPAADPAKLTVVVRREDRSQDAFPADQAASRIP